MINYSENAFTTINVFPYNHGGEGVLSMATFFQNKNQHSERLKNVLISLWLYVLKLRLATISYSF